MLSVEGGDLLGAIGDDGSGRDCLMYGLDCLMCGFDCLMYGRDCLMYGRACLIYGRDCLTSSSALGTTTERCSATASGGVASTILVKRKGRQMMSAKGVICRGQKCIKGVI